MPRKPSGGVKGKSRTTTLVVFRIPNEMAEEIDERRKARQKRKGYKYQSRNDYVRDRFMTDYHRKSGRKKPRPVR
jgi:hypothetical protein